MVDSSGALEAAPERSQNSANERGVSVQAHPRPRGLWGVKFGAANRGRRLDAAARQAIEQKMRDDGRL